VIAIAILTFAAWSLLGPEPRLAHALVNAVGGADHCMPLRARAGDTDCDHGGDGARGPRRRADQEREALELMEKVDTLVIDKTGTLTDGKPRVASLITTTGWNENDLLRLVASLEQGSEHPLGAAVLEAANSWGLVWRTRVSSYLTPAGESVDG